MLSFFFSFHHFYYFRSENKLSIFASIDKGQSISISVIVFVTEVSLMASGYHNMWLSWWMCTVCRCTYYECNCIALLHYLPTIQHRITYCDCHSQQNNVTSVQKFKRRRLSLLTFMPQNGCYTHQRPYFCQNCSFYTFAVLTDRLQ